MKYNRKKLTTKKITMEELSIEIGGKKSKKILITLSIFLAFSVAFYFRLDVSGKIVFDYLFTNRLLIKEPIDSQKHIFQL